MSDLTHTEVKWLAGELRREFARVERLSATRDVASVRHELQMALRRIDDGTYGSCVRCGSQIPYGRLQAIPETQHCLGC